MTADNGQVNSLFSSLNVIADDHFCSPGRDALWVVLLEHMRDQYDDAITTATATTTAAAAIVTTTIPSTTEKTDTTTTTNDNNNNVPRDDDENETRTMQMWQ